jgi:hypothetical protein
MAEFIGREIEVTVGGEVKAPVAFRLGGQEHKVAEVLDGWQDHGFGQAEPLRKNWRLRHHRNYYRVRTSEGQVFEIYMDRGSVKHPERRRWYVYRKL